MEKCFDHATNSTVHVIWLCSSFYKLDNSRFDQMLRDSLRASSSMHRAYLLDKRGRKMMICLRKVDSNKMDNSFYHRTWSTVCHPARTICALLNNLNYVQAHKVYEAPSRQEILLCRIIESRIYFHESVRWSLNHIFSTIFYMVARGEIRYVMIKKTITTPTNNAEGVPNSNHSEHR